METTVPSVTLIAVNDTYRIGPAPDGVGGFARLRALRQQREAEGPVLVLHAGDMLSPALMSKFYGAEQMIDVLNGLDGDGEGFDPYFFATFGNHEFDRGREKYAPEFAARMAQSQFTWLHSNIEFSEEVMAPSMKTDALVSLPGGVKVGLFSVTTDMKNPSYVEAFADEEETAEAAVKALHDRGADLVVAITHLDLSDDVELMKSLDDRPDVLVGGHDHSRAAVALEEGGPEVVFKADADLETAQVITASWPDGLDEDPVITYETVFLEPETVEEDGQLAETIAQWEQRFDEDYCDKQGEPVGCLGEVLGTTPSGLVAAELKIRRFETNLGDWITDLMREHFSADVAVINSGSLRLNYDIPKDTQVSRRQLEELLPFPSEMRLVEITVETLREMLEHSTEDWTGSGHWLQVSGIAFEHRPEHEDPVGRMVLTGEERRELTDPSERLLVVVPEYLLKPEYGQDGYTMLTPEMEVKDSRSSSDVKSLIRRAFEEAGETGIDVAREGRICLQGEKGPCLLQEDF